MNWGLLLLCAALSSVTQAKPSQAAAAQAFLARMGAVADQLDARLTALEEPSAKKDAAALAELAALTALAEALGVKADKLLARKDLPRSAAPVKLRGGRVSWLEASAGDPAVAAQELAGARLNVLAAQFSLLSIALSKENHEGERLTYKTELAKAKSALAALKR
jgi:hypothetical protein